MENAKKQAWSTPELTIHGDVKELTQEYKAKQLGGSDDFGAGISTASGVTVVPT